MEAKLLINTFSPVLQHCSLFQAIPQEQISTILNSMVYELLPVQRDSFIALEGDAYRQISIILSGEVAIKKIYGSGKAVTVTTLRSGDIFGELMVFTQRSLPSTVSAQTDVTLLQIPQQEVLRLCQQHPLFLQNLMRLLSDKIWMLNEKLKLLSYGSLRQKIASFLLEYHHQQETPDLNLPFTRQEMADQLGVPRPSLSRELAAMKRDGLIDYWKHHVRLLQLEKLENIMLE
ncbi:Crp/Fnr family transcriptional regulator [Anoxynatronum buryatiense]|uniref:cAMP-binding domain of CRP or a regulatory subunit of cAMP-dependent protein kinases n=1 Tax=Anoxynatronum buryatiense TaxID=489973 RepID=A0AA45WYH9_9CLOT|nr:Crp/Fnr family transcriptional regulator [Anoxynatronum buryatiense]SMP68646.1 cAMP-binding domain of CRP or a regulatory subunit of cAMP-dependent protein kinases [Anoxynatronum buryatiense]